MAIISAAARLILREHSRSPLQGPALTLGVPDIFLEPHEIGLRRAEDTGDDEESRCISAAQFFTALGIRDVLSLDIPGSAHAPDLTHDLNEPLPASLEGRFNLVLDPGTTEHVFDLRAGLTNVVRALRVGGVVIHFVPIYSYNGGYFSINPILLTDFYLANRFTDIRSFIVMWDRYRPYFSPSRVYPYTEAMHPRHALADHDQCRFSPHLLLFATRTDPVSEIVIPVQHEDHSPRPRRRAGRLLRRVLPSGVATYLVALARREMQLRRSRRNSFWI